MLKQIPSIISPDLMKCLMEMGHGDELILADGNFPAAALANRLIRCDGHGIPRLLEAVLQFFPVDTYVDKPVALMDVVPGDPPDVDIWKSYKSILSRFDVREAHIEFMERQAFYERSRNAYLIVATGESASYANLLLKKGTVTENQSS